MVIMMKKLSQVVTHWFEEHTEKKKQVLLHHFIANIFANDINEITPYDDALQRQTS